MRRFNILIQKAKESHVKGQIRNHCSQNRLPDGSRMDGKVYIHVQQYVFPNLGVRIRDLMLGDDRR